MTDDENQLTPLVLEMYYAFDERTIISEYSIKLYQTFFHRHLVHCNFFFLAETLYNSSVRNLSFGKYFICMGCVSERIWCDDQLSLSYLNEDKSSLDV